VPERDGFFLKQVEQQQSNTNTLSLSVTYSYNISKHETRYNILQHVTYRKVKSF